MSQADDLQRAGFPHLLADERYDELHAAYLSAQDAVRAEPGDPDVAAAYKAARDALAEHRTAGRQTEQRAGVSFGADMIRTEG